MTRNTYSFIVQQADRHVMCVNDVHDIASCGIPMINSALGNPRGLHRRVQEAVDPDRQRTDRNSVLCNECISTLLQDTDLAISAAVLVRDCSGSCNADSHHMLRHDDGCTKENILA